MLTSIFDTAAMQAARSALSGLTRRQEAISGNVANIDTPGYQRRSVSFESALALAESRDTLIMMEFQTYW